MLTDRPTVCFAGPAKGVSALPHAFIVPDHDCDAVGTEMITFLRDRALAAELGANTGATVLVNFEWRQICPKIECIYGRLLAVPTGVARTKTNPRCFGTRALTR
jgi:hypothetical protein